MDKEAAHVFFNPFRDYILVENQDVVCYFVPYGTKYITILLTSAYIRCLRHLPNRNENEKRILARR